MSSTTTALPRLPSLFISHGSPMLAFQQDEYTRALASFAASLPMRPKAVVVVSAHGVSPEPVVKIHGAERPGTVYDFYGFPDELYRIEYPCPGAPELAQRITLLVAEAGFQALLDRNSGLDHGVWIPLRSLFPEADVPVVQITMPYPSRPEQVLKLGRALAVLRDEGVLVVGSGGLVHNLSQLVWHQKDGPAEPWAAEFDNWVLERLQARTVMELCHFEESAPHAQLAHPTPEHFYPIFFTLGASCPGDGLEIIYKGIQYSSISMTCFALKAHANYSA